MGHNEDLPLGWARSSLGTVGVISTGRTPSKANAEYYGGGVLFAKPGDLKRSIVRETEDRLSPAGFAASRQLRAGAVLVSCIGNLGKVGLAGAPIACNQQINAIEFNNGVVADSFGFYYCWTLQPWLEANSSATTISIVNKGRFSEAPIKVPPLLEQRRIVAKIDSLLASSKSAKDTLAAVPALLDRLRQSILAAAFRGDLTADWRARNPDVEPADKLLEKIRAERRRRWEAAELARLTAKGKPPTDDRWKERYNEGELGTPALQPALPRGWTWASLDQLRAYETVVVYGIILPGDHVPGGVPYVRPVDIKPDGAVNIADLGRTTEAIAESHSRASLAAGDVILSIVGTIGKVMIVPPELSGGNITQSSARIRTGPWLSPEILQFMLMCPCLIAQYDKFRFGNAVQRLNVEHVRNLMIPLPPTEEQRVILQRLRRLLDNGLAAAHSQLKEQLAHLDKAVLAKAFRGELVPQDPNDEPASVLLERLRAEAAAAPAKPGRRPSAPAASESPAAPVKASAAQAAPVEPTPSAKPGKPAAAPAQPPLPGIPPTDFLELPAANQSTHIHALLLGEGALGREDAVRRAAELLREAGRASFQRLRRDGTLATCIDAAIAMGLKAGSFDRPAPGVVRALAPTADTVPPALWRRALLAALADPGTDADAAVRDAAAWSQAQFGLEFQRLRAGGRIDTALRAVLAEMLASRELVNDRHGILSPGPRRG